jgi:hypothetical protein
MNRHKMAQKSDMIRTTLEKVRKRLKNLDVAVSSIESLLEQKLHEAHKPVDIDTPPVRKAAVKKI